MMDKYKIVGEILKNLNLESELVSFKENIFDDEVLKLVKQIDDLKELIPSLGFRITFFNEIKRVQDSDLKFQKFINNQVKKFATNFAISDTKLNQDWGTKSEKMENNGFATNYLSLSQIQMDKILDICVQKYTQEMEKWTDKKLFKETELIEAHFSIKNQTIEENLKKIKETYEKEFNSNFVENLKLHIESNINEKFSQNQVSHFEKLEKLQEKVDRTMDHFDRVYCQNMNKHLDKWYKKLMISPEKNFRVDHGHSHGNAAFDFENYLANFVNEIPQKVLQDFDKKVEENIEGFKTQFQNIRKFKKGLLFIMGMVIGFVLSSLYN